MPYETIASMTGIEQMDQLDAQRSIVLARTQGGGLNLAARCRSPNPSGGQPGCVGRV